jgi:hypothetical protein
VGRYDTIVLPLFLVLIAVGLDNALRLRVWFGAALGASVLGLAAVSSSTALATDSVADPDVAAAQYLNSRADSNDEIVTTGLRRAVVAFYMDRAGHHREFRSFPYEISEHPGWHSPERMMRDPDRLRREGEELAATLWRAAERGHGIWILPSGANPIDQYLYAALDDHLTIDETRSRRDIEVFCLIPTP